MKLPSNEGGTFEKCPSGNHLAVCYQVVDLGTQQTNYGPKRRVWLGWETPHETMDDGRPYVIGKQYTLSANEKATLRKDLESWRGSPFKDSEFGPAGTFEIQSVIGHGCFLNVVHTESGERVYANVQTVAPMPKGTNAPEPINTPTFVSLDPEEFDSEAFDRLSDWMKQKVAASPEFKKLGAKASAVTMPDIPDGPSAYGDDDSGENPF